MDKLLLTVIVVSGLSSGSSAAARRYHVAEEPRTWKDAQNFCRENHKDLASIRNREDLEDLRTLMKTVPKVSFMTGGLTYEYEQQTQEFRAWNPGEPNDGDKGADCAGMSSSGLWGDYWCYKTRKTLCSDATGPNLFVLITSLMTWNEALKYCREHHTDLAIVRNEQENLMARNLDASEDILWIGLHRYPWKWSDGSDSSFEYWGLGEPSDSGDSPEACVAADFSADGGWETLDCDAKSAFICYTDVPVLKRVVKVRLEKSDSALDLNDPVVTENLLEKLKQKLRDQGLNDDIKLSWKKQSDGKVFHEEEKKTKKKESCDEL